MVFFASLRWFLHQKRPRKKPFPKLFYVVFRNRNVVIAILSEKKNPAEAGFLISVCPMKSRLGGNVSCLETFWSFFYLIGDRLTFAQGFEA